MAKGSNLILQREKLKTANTFLLFFFNLSIFVLVFVCWLFHFKLLLFVVRCLYSLLGQHYKFEFI